MNFVRGKLLDGITGGHLVRVGSAEAPIAGIAGHGEREVVIGFRPNEVRIDGATRPGCLKLKVRVGSIQPVGASVLVEVLQDGAWSGSVETDWRNCSVRAGDDVTIELDARHLHLFDAQTEERVA